MTAGKWVDGIKKFDAFQKTIEDAKLRTLSGATISVVSFVVIMVMIIFELNAYLTPTISEELFVDYTRGHKLQINFDLFIPSISCDYLSLDAMDSTGEQHVHIEHDVFKRRMDLHGNPIDQAKKENITMTKLTGTTTVTPDTRVGEVKCGSCYGAQFNETHCCNTCQDVIDAYREKRWNPNIHDFVQCEEEQKADKAKEAYALKESCQFYGRLQVNRMSGSFHFAPGKSFSINHIHVHDVQPFSSTSFNTSHTINHLSFGEKIDYGTTHTLDGWTAIADRGGFMYQYYIKIVPTMYVFINGTIVHTNQFSVTTYSKAYEPGGGDSGMPGIFFSYELSPLMVKITESTNSFGHFITNCCAIIGGIYVVASLVDSFVFSSYRAFKRKIELGKFS